MGATNSKKIKKSNNDRDELINTINEISSDLILNISDDEIINLINKKYCMDLVNLSTGLLKDLNIFNLVIINDHITDKKIFNTIDILNIKLGKSPAAPAQAKQEPAQAKQEPAQAKQEQEPAQAKQEPVKQEPANQEPEPAQAKQEQAPAQAKQEPTKQEPAKQEPKGQTIKLNMNDISEVLNKKTIEQHQTKHAICENIAVYYVKIAHIYAAIVKIIDFDKKGFCNKKHNEFFIENFVIKKNNKNINKSKIKTNYCNAIKKNKKVEKPDFDDEIGIPELEKLYLNKYDTKLGKFVMDEENKKKYLEDVKTFYKIYTNKEWDGKTKKFSEIPIYEYKPISFCKQKKATAVLEGNEKNENIQNFANQLALIMNNSYSYDKELIKILNELFIFNGDKLRINLQMNKKVLDEKYEEVRNIIFNIYKNCERDYQKTILLFQKIVLDTQIKISNEIINNDDYSNIPQNVKLSSREIERLYKKKEAHKAEIDDREREINEKVIKKKSEKETKEKEEKEEKETREKEEKEYKQNIEKETNKLKIQADKIINNLKHDDIMSNLLKFFFKIQEVVIDYLENIKDEPSLLSIINNDGLDNIDIANYISDNYNVIITEVDKKMSEWFEKEDESYEIKIILSILFKKLIDSKKGIIIKYKKDPDNKETALEKRIILRMGGEPDIQKYFIDIFVKTLIWNDNSDTSGQYDEIDHFTQFINEKIITPLDDHTM